MNRELINSVHKNAFCLSKNIFSGGRLLNSRLYFVNIAAAGLNEIL